MNNELEMKWKDALLTYFEALLGLCLQIVRVTGPTAKPPAPNGYYPHYCDVRRLSRDYFTKSLNQVFFYQVKINDLPILNLTALSLSSSIVED
jgi:hypothetical protein